VRVISFNALRESSTRDWLRPSIIALIAANLVPLFGVLFLGWEVFPLMFLFWSENVVIGLMNVLKMLFAGPGSGNSIPARLFMMVFFSIHYGMFTLVHGIFVMVLFGGDAFRPHGGPSPTMFLNVIREYHLGWALLGLFASHAVSFVSNYIRKGEYRQAELGKLMSQPYARIFILHIAIIGSGFLVAALKSPTAGLVLLILLKIAFDLAAHMSERKKFSRPAAETITSRGIE